jgi:dipeptidyl aminopeptidase/acylaminoacyl peptidase
MKTLESTSLFELRFLRSTRLSPDARFIVYALSWTDDAEHFEIWTADASGGNQRRLPYAGDATAPRFSPDGRWIAFVGDGQLRLAECSSLSLSEPLTPVGLCVQGAPAWSPDGERIAVSLMRHDVRAGPRRITKTHFCADGRGFLEDIDQQIYEVRLGNGTVRRLTGSEGFCSQPEWSPCGTRILFFASEDAVPFGSYSPHLRVIDVNRGVITEVLGESWYVTSAHWLPDGERIAVAAARDSTLTVPTLSVWVVNVADRHAELRTTGLTGNVGFHIHHDMPAWDLTQDNSLIILNEAVAFATVQRGGSVEIWRVSLSGETRLDRVISGDRSCIALDAHEAADTLLFAVTDLRSPPELSKATLRGEHGGRLTALNHDVLSRWPAIEAERFSFTSGDGLEIDAWFMSGTNLKRPLPTVLFIHGGPFISTGYAFRYDFHLLCAHGFGVLFANFRGSAGYGEAFARAIMGDWGRLGYPDHIGAVDSAIARGLADPERLGVWGPSHGGFATCWIVGHTDRFKAAVAEAAVTNFTTAYYLTDAPDGFRRDLGGRPHELAEIYRTRSPIAYAHRCTTPTLLIHGEEDLRCPISEAEQFYRVLKDVGCSAELLRIPGCSHLGDSLGPLSARSAQNEALLSWFQRYL